MQSKHNEGNSFLKGSCLRRCSASVSLTEPTSRQGFEWSSTSPKHFCAKRMTSRACVLLQKSTSPRLHAARAVLEPRPNRCWLRPAATGLGLLLAPSRMLTPTRLDALSISLCAHTHTPGELLQRLRLWRLFDTCAHHTHQCLRRMRRFCGCKMPGFALRGVFRFGRKTLDNMAHVM